MGYSQLEDQAPAEVDAIVILGGGGTTFRHAGDQIDMLSSPSSLRLLEGLRLYRELSPRWLVVSGGPTARAGSSVAESETMASILTELGVPAEVILIEAEFRQHA